MPPNGPAQRPIPTNLYPEDIPLIEAWHAKGDVGWRAVVCSVADRPGATDIVLGLTTLGAGAAEVVSGRVPNPTSTPVGDAQTAGAQISQPTAVAGGPAARPGVRAGEVDTHANLTSRQLPNDGLQLDHQPSHASNVLRRSLELGRPLTAAEEAEVFSQGTAVALPDEVHALSPTFRNLNTPALQAADAADPVGAAIRDSNAMLENTARLRPELLAEIKAAAIEIVQRIKDGFGL
jgi:hypothetical protein